MTEQIKIEVSLVVHELLEQANLKKGQLVVIGCSTSEILGKQIGTASSLEIAELVFHTIYDILFQKEIRLAAQCCEHLNRAIIIERTAASNDDIVNVVPQPKAGGSFATAAYHCFKDPIAVEKISADSGIDIGGTLIGMHLKEVAVPIRLQQKTIGSAMVIAARTRPKFIGGSRAVYDQSLL